MPRLDRGVRDRLLPIAGSPPSLIHLPSGCSFHPRCAYAGTDGIPCKTVVPPLIGDGEHLVSCHLGIPTRREIFRGSIAPSL
jgi:peptide/nickel transport system ATP-binding protein